MLSEAQISDWSATNPVRDKLSPEIKQSKVEIRTLKQIEPDLSNASTLELGGKMVGSSV